MLLQQCSGSESCWGTTGPGGVRVQAETTDFDDDTVEEI